LLQLKNLIEQANLKIESDSVNLEAAETQFNIAEEQYARAVKLQQQGLISLTDLEARKLKKQEAQAKKITASNKLLSSRNEYLNAEMELQAIDAEYRDKISKSESEKFATMSALFDAEAVVTKLQNQYMNYSVRLGLYYVTAPQNCIITRVVKPGIGETVKEGEDLVSIMPADFSLAVEWNIEPIDLPLIQVGQKVRFLFDGWPAIVFTGWPELTFGTFGGKVVAIDNFTNEEGKYRVLVAPDENETSWPSALRAGSAANGIALLKEVPVWYELWRKFNGFPPDYYAQTTDKKEK
jgi:multidrug resistance efflux pump